MRENMLTFSVELDPRALWTASEWDVIRRSFITGRELMWLLNPQSANTEPIMRESPMK